MHFMAVKLDGRESRMPAALSPQLMLCIHGATSIKGSDGSLLRRPRLVLNGPCLGARHSYSEPETIAISVMFRPGLLQEVLPIAVREINSGFLDLGDIVGGERVQALFDAVDKETAVSEQVRLFQDFLLVTLNLTAKKKSIGAAFLAAHQMAFLPLIDFAEYFHIGERQLERRMQRVFGVSLRDVRRVYLGEKFSL